MTKKNNANSARRKLIPAVGMLVASAMMLSSSTYAWFTMSDSVTVTGMNLQAPADGGIIIRNELENVWATQVSASYAGTGKAVLPTSTSDTTDWYYRMSSQFDDEEGDQAANAYTDLTTGNNLVDTRGGENDLDGVYGITSNGVTKDYYLLNKFYIKSSGQALADKNITVTSVKATAPEDSVSGNLNKALRVAVKIGNDVYIYAPFNTVDANLTYHVGGSTTTEGSTTWHATVTAIKPGSGGALATPSVADDATIPANTATITGDNSANPAVPKAIEADVYLYFEGEDPDCKSSNIAASFDTLNVEISFGMANT